MEKTKLKFVLASTSPRRKELIGHLKVPYEIQSLNIPEESDETDPVKFSKQISDMKGEAVFRKLLNENPSGNYFVVSADTIVCLNGKIYGKPADRNEARQILQELSGKNHSVYTAVTINLSLSGQSHKHSFVEETKVTFNTITNALMERYLDTGDSLDKAGAYGIQNGSLTFISRVDGDYSNVVGFPLSRFVIEAESFLKSKIAHEDLWLNLF
jgi:septum formation protein